MFWNLSISGRSDHEASKHTREIKPSVKAVLKLSQIAVSIFFKIKRMVCADDGIFQVAEDCINPPETVHVGAFTTFANNFSLMEAVCGFNSLEAPKSI
jgi:hypothetical protein